MKRGVLLALLLCGCAGARRDGNNVSVAGVQATVDCAALAARNATRHTAAAKVSLQVASAKSRELLAVVNSDERPLVVELSSALDQAHVELSGVQEQLNAAEGALTDSSQQIGAVQEHVRVLGSELGKAQEAVNQLKAGRDFWRACVWKLSLLALALGLWTFRKPLIAICGGPIL